jgi:hypothetical protein
VAIFERIFKVNLWRKNDFCPLFLANCPLLKLKMASNFCLIYWVFLGVVAKNPLFSLINCEEKIYIFIIISQKKWANGQKHKNKAFLKKEDVI